MEHLWFYIRGALKAVFILINNLYAIPTHLLWMLTLSPLSWLKPELYWWIEGVSFEWLLTMVAAWTWADGYQKTGDDTSECLLDESLVIANHQSMADVPMLMQCFVAKPGLTSKLYWIMDKHFMYTNFGWVSLVHGDFFISSGREARESTLVLLKKHLEEKYKPRPRSWMILFPEGGFLRKRREASLRFAKKNDLPLLKHVALPRAGAFQTISETMHPRNTLLNGHQCLEHKRKRLKWVIDITIGYPAGIPLDYQCIAFGNRSACQTLFHYKKYPIEEVPIQEKEATEWLYKRFIEKEEILEEYYKSGRFPSTSSNHPRVVQHSYLRLLLLHLFYLLSSYFHWCVLCRILS